MVARALLRSLLVSQQRWACAHALVVCHAVTSRWGHLRVRAALASSVPKESCPPTNTTSYLSWQYTSLGRVYPAMLTDMRTSFTPKSMHGLWGKKPRLQMVQPVCDAWLVCCSRCCACVRRCEHRCERMELTVGVADEARSVAGHWWCERGYVSSHSQAEPSHATHHCLHAAAWSIPIYSKNVTRVREHLAAWSSSQPSSQRGNWMPHIKTFSLGWTHVEPQSKREQPHKYTRLVYTLMGSHNMSSAAWGSYQSKVRVRHRPRAPLWLA